jgi:hypothetical protein
MPSRVTLKTRNGELNKTIIEFTERATVIVGRGLDSNLVIPPQHRSISRRQCLLDINPPEIQVRDTGSMFGTFLNGKLIGKREEGETPEEGQRRAYSAFPLHHGDRLMLGRSRFELEVEIEVAVVCQDCGIELAPAEQVDCRIDGQFVCASCQRKARPRVQPKANRDDVLAMMLKMIELAQQDEPDLAALKQYEIQDELGAGGFGIVYRAKHRATQRIVAIKLMRPAVAAKRSGRRHFDRERANMQALNHPNIVRFYETGQFAGNYYLAMEYCEHGAILDRMKARRRLMTVDEALYFTFQALDGLTYAHQAEIPNVLCENGEYRSGKGMVHRDLKPANLFLTGPVNRPLLKVADFGLAKAFDLASMSGMTATGTQAGTPHFMPRQQVLNFRYAQPDVDVWAMAATLYFMLTGTYPKPIQMGDDPWVAAVDREATPIRRHRRDLPQKLADVIDTALVDNPSLYFETALEFKYALEKAL